MTKFVNRIGLTNNDLTENLLVKQLLYLDWPERVR